MYEGPGRGRTGVGEFGLGFFFFRMDFHCGCIPLILGVILSW